MIRSKEQNQLVNNYDVAIADINYGALIKDIAEGFAEKGLKVLVVVPNRDYKRPDEVSESKKINNNLYIKRIPIPRLDKNKMIQKMLIIFIFGFKAQHFLQDFRIKIYMAALMPVFIPYKILKISKKNKKPFLLMLEDLVPDTWIRRKRFSKKNPMVWYFGRQTRILLEDAEKIIAIGRDMKSYLKAHYKVPSEKIEFIPNWAKKRDSLSFDQPLEDSDKFIVLYGGTIGEAQNLEPLILAADLLKNRDQSVEFLIIGSGMKKAHLQKMKQERQLNNVLFYDLLPEYEYKKIMEQANLLVISLRDESKGMSVPSKTYSSLASGKPLLAIVPKDSEIYLEIQEDKFGITCEPKNPHEIAESILKLKNNKGLYIRYSQNAIKAHKLKYNDETSVNKYYQIISKLLNRTNGES